MVRGRARFVILAGAGGVYWIYQKLNGNITSATIDDKLGEDRPEDLSPGAKTILVAGSDTREGMDDYGAVEGMRSDTLMILHIAENREWATVVSIPRDSWVEIPACDMGDGVMSDPHHAKINESYALGGINGDAGGAAACTIRTLEQNTGLRIENFVSLDFLGFKDMVDALGGVDMCLDEPIDDVKAHVTLDAGCQTLNGEDALGFVRVRYSVGDGSDIGRIERQQEFMNALAEKAQSKLTSPTSLYVHGRGHQVADHRPGTGQPGRAVQPGHRTPGRTEGQAELHHGAQLPARAGRPHRQGQCGVGLPGHRAAVHLAGQGRADHQGAVGGGRRGRPVPVRGTGAGAERHGHHRPGRRGRRPAAQSGFQVVSTGNADPGTEVSTISYPEGLEGHAEVLGLAGAGAQTQQTTDDLPACSP